jgi:hypothetical protein
VESEPSFLSISSLTFLAEDAGPTDAQRALTGKTPPAQGKAFCMAGEAPTNLAFRAKTAAVLQCQVAESQISAAARRLHVQETHEHKRGFSAQQQQCKRAGEIAGRDA